jgi:hypothetical protein
MECTTCVVTPKRTFFRKRMVVSWKAIALGDSLIFCHRTVKIEHIGFFSSQKVKVICMVALLQWLWFHSNRSVKTTVSVLQEWGKVLSVQPRTPASVKTVSITCMVCATRVQVSARKDTIHFVLFNTRSYKRKVQAITFHERTEWR